MRTMSIITGKWKENCYVVMDENGDSLIIDPGSDEESIVDFIEANNLKILSILNTHAHFDHIGAVKVLKDKYSVPFYLHSKDRKLLKYANLYMKIFEGDSPVKVPVVDYFFDQTGMTIQLGKFLIHVLFTPGHTEGGVCFRIENLLFTGDTLLKGGIGRVDFPGGDETTLKKSLKIISKLPGNILVYPGHGEPTTLSSELKYNMKFIEAIQWAQLLNQ
jgi:hydroxyacylglutathione hydrolase